MRFAFVGLAVLVLVMDSGAEEPKPTKEPRWTQLPLEVCGVDVYRERYPGRDGRGVVVAVLDTGVDMGVAGLTKCPDGSVKVIDAQDFSGEGDVALKPVSVDAKSGKIVRHGKGGAPEAYGPPPETLRPAGAKLYFGIFDEQRFRNTDIADINDNGRRDDEFAVLVVASPKGGDDDARVFVDTDSDRDFGDETPLRNYRLAHDTFTFPRAKKEKQRTQMRVCVNVFLKDKKVVLHYDSGGHGTHVAGIATGFRLLGQPTFHGLAPGAKVLSLKIGDNRLSGGSTTTGSKKAAFEYAARYAREHRVPVVCNLSYGIGSERDGASEIDKFLDRLCAENPFLTVCVSAGNEGPGLSTIGTPAAARLPITCAAMLATQTARDVMGARIDAHQIAPFSSRGGELAKPDLLTPGFLTSSVPRWERWNDFWSGTSMASPYAAGLCTLLIGDIAAESPGKRVYAAWVKRALARGARALEGYTVLDQGPGLPALPKSVDILRRLAAGSSGPLTGFDVETESPMAPGGKGSTAYWRTVWVPGGKTQEFRLTPRFAPGPNADEKESFSARYTVHAQAPWLDAVQEQVYFRGPQSATVKVRYDAAALEGSPGLHIGAVELRDGAGVVHRLWNTVIVPDTFTGANGYRRQFPDAQVRGWRPDRYFVAVPVGASGMQVRLDAVPGKASTARVGRLFRPNGTAVWAGRLNIDTKKGRLSAQREVTTDLRPGVWEICVTSDRPDEASDYRLTVVFRGVSASPPVVSKWSHPVGGTPAGTLKFVNLLETPLHVALKGELLGYRETVTRTIEPGSDTARVPVKFSEEIRAIRVRSKMTRDEYALFTDVAVNLLDPSGKSVFKDGFNDRAFDRTIDSPGKDASCSLEILGAFTHRHGDSKAKLTIKIDYLYREPGKIRCKSGGKTEVTLYPGVEVPMSFSLEKTPPAAPDGTKPLGQIEIRDRAHKSAALIVPILIGD